MRQEMVKDWMSRDVVTVTPDTTLPEADRLMLCKMVRRLPVVEDDQLVGLVTYGDIRNARPSSVTSLSIWELNYLVTHITVAQLMSRNLVTVSYQATIGEAAQLMLKNMISGLPVLDDRQHLVGIITESDVFRMVVHDWIREKEQTPEAFAHYG